MHVEVNTNKKLSLGAAAPLHRQKRPRYPINKVDFPLAGPISAGALVNLVNKVMAGVGGHLGKSESEENGWMRGSRIKTEGKIAAP